MEDDTDRFGKCSLRHDDRPSAAVKQKVGAETGTGDNAASSTREPRRDNEQQEERPSSSDAGFANVSGEGSSGGPLAVTVQADSHSERPVIAVSGHGWPVDDLDSMFDQAEENAPLPESLPVHLEAAKHATDHTHYTSDRAAGHDTGKEHSGDGNLERASALSGDDDNNICSAPSSGVAATGDGEGQPSSTGSASASATHGAGACGAGAGTGVDADAGAGSVAETDGGSAVTNAVGSLISAAAAAATVAEAADVEGAGAGAGAGSVAQTDGIYAFTDAVGSPTATATAAAAVAATATVEMKVGADEEGVVLTGEATAVTPPLPLPQPTPRRTPATPRAAANAGEHDDWKDYSCATPWEYFVNDVGNAMGAFDSREAVADGVARSEVLADGEGGWFEGRRKELPYLGRSYVLRKLLQRDSREVSTADSSPKPIVDNSNQEPLRPPWEGFEFPRLVGFWGDEECSLDALLESEPEQSVSEQGLIEQEEAWRLLCSWFGLREFFCLHESGSATPQSPGTSGPQLSLEQLLSTAVMAMEHRRCAAVLAFQPPGNDRRGSERKGVSVKGHAILSHGTSGWTRLAETVRMESETSSNVPPSRQSLEDFGELLEDKAIAAWGRCGEGGRLEASARYTWERRLYDGRTLGEGGDAWQTEWRTRARRERSHRRRGSRDRAVRSLLAAIEREGVTPAWGTEEDPLDGIRLTALWRGLGGERPLPRAPLELVGGPSAGGVAVDWNATVSWETVSAGAWSDGVAREGREGSLGFKLRLLLAVYVQSLALGGDVLMADVGNSGNEANVSSARERARHIGAVLGPGTRALIAQMRATTQHDQANSGGGGGGGDGDPPGADPTEIVHSARYLLTPRRASLSYRETLGASNSGRGWDSQDRRQQQQQQQTQTPTTTPRKETPSRMETPRRGYGHSVSPSPWPSPALGVRSPGFGIRACAMGGAGTDSGGSVGRTPPRKQCGVEADGGDGGATPWLWVPRGGAPACRLVSQVASEAARFGTHGVCLGDVAAFWKSFVQELRFLWEEGASVPRMDPEPPVDGYSMYDPSATGQDAAGSARLRRHMTAPVDINEGETGNGTETCSRGGSTQGDCKHAAAANEAPTFGVGDEGRHFARPCSVSSGGTGGASGASGVGRAAYYPPPPDMRTCLLHQKLQMLNCCVAEQNRAKALALSTRSSPVGLASPSTPTWNAPSVNAGGGEAGPEDEPAGKPPVLDHERARFAGSPSPITPGRNETTGISSNDEGGGGGGGGGRGGSGGGSGACIAGSGVSESVAVAVPAGSLGNTGKTGSNRGRGGGGSSVGPENIDRRDSEKMKAAFAAERDAILRRVGVKKEGSGGGKATGGRWWGFGGRPKETTEPSPALPPSLRHGGAEEATRSGADDGGSADSKQRADPPRASGKVGGAVMRVGGTLKRVGGVVRKAGGAVHKARRGARDDAALKKIDTPGELSAEGSEGGRVFRDGRGDREAGLKTPGAAGRGTWDDHGAGAAAAAAATSMKFTGDRLLVTGEWVLVPELMQPCPLTSDMLEQQMELVRRLSVRAGSNSADADVSRNRVSRLRFETLSADMRCFIRENPGAVFADFVRWYSPRNWLGGSAQRHGYAGLKDADGDVTAELFPRFSDVEDVMRALVDSIVERATGHAVGVLPCTAATTSAAAATAAAAVSTLAAVSPTTAAVCAPADEGATHTDGARALQSRGEIGTTEDVTTPPVTTLTSVGGAEADIEAERIPLPPSPLPPPPPPATQSTPPATSDISSSGWKMIIPRSNAAAPNASAAGVVPDVAASVVGDVSTTGGGSGGIPDGEGSRSPIFDRDASTRGTRAGGGEGCEGTEKRSGLPPSLLSSSFPSSVPSLLGSPPCPRRLDWGRRGKVEWRPTVETAAAVTTADGDFSCGVDEKEGAEWMETWLEVEHAVAEENEGGVCRPRNLFNPAQEAEKALHYLETIGPAQLMSQLLMALACTSGFLLSEAQTDALELPCVRAALSRVNLAVLSASEGLYEASAGGGVLLMGNRVAHPISQATLVACDALCDAVDDAEVLLSRGTSLLHKLPGEYGLVEALVTANSTGGRHNASPARAGEPALSGLGGASGSGGAVTGRRADDGGLDALVRYLSSGNPSPPFSSPGGSPIPPKEDGGWRQQHHQEEQRQQQEQQHHQERGYHREQQHRQEQGHRQEQRHHQEQKDHQDRMHRQWTGSSGSSGPRATVGGVASELRSDNALSSGDKSTRDRTDDHGAILEGSNGVPQTTATTTSAAAATATTPTTTPTRGAGTPNSLLSARDAMPQARVREYSVRWRLPPLADGSVRKMKRTGEGPLPVLADAPVQKRKIRGEGDDSEVKDVGARLYARVMASGNGARGDDEGDVETDVRLAVSIAEPASMCRL